jgi:hypothetical protein
MIHLEHVADSKPGPSYEYIKVDGLTFSKSVFAPGMWQTMRFAEACTLSGLASAHIQTTGTLRDEAGVLPDRPPGWLSREDHFLVPAGEHTRTAQDLVTVWCCRGGDCQDVKTVAVPQGETITISQGMSALIADGSLVLDGKQYVGPRIIRAATGDKTFMAEALTYVFLWPEVLQKTMGSEGDR